MTANNTRRKHMNNYSLKTIVEEVEQASKSMKNCRAAEKTL